MPVSGCLWPTILTISLGPPTMASKSPVQRDPSLPPPSPLITISLLHIIQASPFIYRIYNIGSTNHFLLPKSPITDYIPAAAGAIHLSHPHHPLTPSHHPRTVSLGYIPAAAGAIHLLCAGESAPRLQWPARASEVSSNYNNYNNNYYNTRIYCTHHPTTLHIRKLN